MHSYVQVRLIDVLRLLIVAGTPESEFLILLQMSTNACLAMEAVTNFVSTRTEALCVHAGMDSFSARTLSCAKVVAYVCMCV